MDAIFVPYFTAASLTDDVHKILFLTDQAAKFPTTAQFCICV